MTAVLLWYAVVTGVLAALLTVVVLVQEGAPLVRRLLRGAAVALPTGP